MILLSAKQASLRVPLRGGSLLGVVFLVFGLCLLVALISFTPFFDKIFASPKIVEKVVEKEVVKIKKVREPFPVPQVISKKGVDLQKISNGIELATSLQVETGEQASIERKKDENYRLSYTLELSEPQAAFTREDLEKTAPHLFQLLPGLLEMMPEARVSDFYQNLYDRKKKRLRKNLQELEKLLTRHNYYDCETMLELKSPSTGRKVFLLQAEMDVVADGSDGDRLAEMPESIVNSTHYQPFTSYGWKKQTRIPNPMVAGWVQRIENADVELRNPQTKSSRREWLINRKKYLRTGIEDMEKRSFLIAEHDPFIVVPTNQMLAKSHPYAPNVGDYAVVIYGEKLYPAIVGDAGPTFKVGEASLRLAKEINPVSTPYHRPVSDLTVTYLIFPKSAPKTKKPPHFKEWREACERLLSEIGGSSKELHEWEVTLPTREEIQTPAAGPDPVQP